ncbi:Fic family protein [Lysinibacillus sp. KU-BSD001]|uniref:Fic/DOC family protein n=1 Tax=Lysinibacillus sp. KU-BSD001 TaxID=3141328 RepID=UPI0036E80CB7
MEKYNFGADVSYLLTHNKLGIQTMEQLERAEAYAFMIRALEIENGLYKVSHFTKRSFMDLHRYLFQDIYTFAGQFRRVQLSKGTTRFCQFQYIDQMADEIFKAIQVEEDWQDIEMAAKRLAHFKTELNMLHPFREGNGRATRIFIHAYARTKGYEWDYASLEKDEYMQAMIESVVDTTLLEHIFYRTLSI